MPIGQLVAAILLPPLGVFLARGIGRDFWINCVLTLFGYVPGLVHAVWLVAQNRA
ncbi:MAG: YqaE/Pmp3 family membrane protein [Janthinobacterium lividum]